MDRLSLGDKLVGGGGVLLFLLSFIGPWAKVDLGGFGDIAGVDTSGNAWDGYGFFPLKLALILALVAAGFVIAKAAGMAMPAMPAMAPVALNGAILVLVLLAVVMGPVDIAFADVIDRGLMLYIAIIPAAAMAYGGYLQMQEAGGTSTMGGTATPPPPPGV